MKALGAKIVTSPTAAGMEGAIEEATKLAQKTPNSYTPQQFSNPSNTKAHYATTAREIYEQLIKESPADIGKITKGLQDLIERKTA